MRECISHHHACDCRERMLADRIAELESRDVERESRVGELLLENQRLREENNMLRDMLDPFHALLEGE